MTNKPTFFIVYSDGRAENLDLHQNWTWKSILEKVYLHGMSAGSVTPLPDDLYRNGDLVATDLWGKAFKWGQRQQELRDQLAETLSTEFPCPWEDQ